MNAQCPLPVLDPQIQPSPVEPNGNSILPAQRPPVALASSARPSGDPEALTLTAQLLNPQPTGNFSMVPATPPLNQPLAVVEAKPLPVPSFGHHRQRNGRVARLPKAQRDMVNRMLWNAIPYKNIAAALNNTGFPVSERHLSSWATGGYLEWKAEQELVLNHRLDQDRLLNFLRRDDAPELPEVGLQAAATRLSQSLLQKLARGDDPEANLDNFSRMVDLLCRLNREIGATQKARDHSRLTLGPEHNPARVREAEEVAAIETEEYYSDPPEESGLEVPEEAPQLPQLPTAVSLARDAETERLAQQLRNQRKTIQLLKMSFGKKTPAPDQLNAPNPDSNSNPAQPVAPSAVPHKPTSQLPPASDPKLLP